MWVENPPSAKDPIDLRRKHRFRNPARHWSQVSHAEK
jgi:hypothetical protein